MGRDFIHNSMSVTQGHPDKLCDAVSDALVDRFLRQDPFSRIQVECAVFNAVLFIAARYASEASVDIAHTARKIIAQIGYDQPDFNAGNCSILASPRQRPLDDRFLFDERTLTDEEIDAIPSRKQTTVFGYACNQSPDYLPLTIHLAHKLAQRMDEVRLSGELDYLMPEGRTHVGVEYVDRKPVRISGVTLTTAQKEDAVVDHKTMEKDFIRLILDPVFADAAMKPDKNTDILVNPDGPIIVGGPSNHSGLTGRKNAVDTYGEYSRHSAKGLSGKDPLRIDRVGAYAARHAAKNVVAAGLAHECEVQLSYAIGRAEPSSVQVEMHHTGSLTDKELVERLKEHFDFRLAGIVKNFNLRRVSADNPEGFYRHLAAYGHVGRDDLNLPWEQIDKVHMLKG